MAGGSDVMWQSMTSREIKASVPRWYVVYTQPHGEYRAAINLRQQGFPVFLPTVRKTVRHARQFRTREAPFFPRYLFVGLSLDHDRWRSVNGTFGVSTLIMDGERPRAVPQAVMESLLSVADETGRLVLEPVLAIGQTVRLGSGPFAGLVGTLCELDEKGRVKVLLDLMNTKLAVSARDVNLLPAA